LENEAHYQGFASIFHLDDYVIAS